MQKAYYGSKISPNRTRTPEGYLICRNVPIARTGWQEYLPEETDGKTGNKIAELYRSPEEVFSPATIASFENKPVTNDHPSSWVEPSNVSAYLKGVATNVRQGVDDESDLLLADLTIYDPTLISLIDGGKKEVSCGYEYEVFPIEGQDDKFTQRNIRGNHIAIVQAGRAGDRVAVKDEKPKNGGMKKMKNGSILGRMFKAFAKDAEPDELLEASNAIHKAEAADDGEMVQPPVKPAAPATPAVTAPEGAKDADPAAGGVEKILSMLEDMSKRLAALEQSDKEVHASLPKPENALDALEAELETPAEQAQEDFAAGAGTEPDNHEEVMTIEPEKIGDEAPVSAPEDRPKNPIPGADSKAAIKMAIGMVKPFVAAIKDPVERRKAQDSLAKTFREKLKPDMKKSSNPAVNAYAAMLNTKKPKAMDSNFDESKIGEHLKYTRNPHYKNKGDK